jgi:hypothetical protein
VYTDVLSNIFKFTALPVSMILAIFGLTFIYIICNEIAKFFMRRKNLYNRPIVSIPVFK